MERTLVALAATTLLALSCGGDRRPPTSPSSSLSGPVASRPDTESRDPFGAAPEPQASVSGSAWTAGTASAAADFLPQSEGDHTAPCPPPPPLPTPVFCTVPLLYCSVCEPELDRVEVFEDDVVLRWEYGYRCYPPPRPCGTATNFIVEVGSGPGLSDLATVEIGNAYFFSVPDVPHGTYYVRLRAKNYGGVGGPSNEVQVAVRLAYPSAPPNLTASPNGRNLHLTWGRAAFARDYIVEVGSASGRSDLGRFEVGNVTSFDRTDVAPGTYYIRVRARNELGGGPPSNEAVVTVAAPNPPLAPANLTVDQTTTRVSLFWQSVLDADGYIIEAGSFSGGSNLARFDVGPTTTFVREGGLAAGSYFVRVRARNRWGIGLPSNEIQINSGGPPPGPQPPPGPGCEYRLSTTTFDVEGSGATRTVGVTTEPNCSWTATAWATFITITAGASGIGSGTVTFTVAPNTGNILGRIGTLTIAGQTVVVNQAPGTPAPGPQPPPGPACQYGISTATFNVEGSGATRTVAVTTQPNCSWTATAWATFITIVSGTSGIGNGMVTFTVAPNTGNRLSRGGTMTVAGHTVTVNQAPGVP